MKHLTYEDRCSIERMLTSKTSFKQIGRTIGKDCTTVSKEVQSRKLFRRTGGYGRVFCDCLKRTTCKRGSACLDCVLERRCAQCPHCYKYCSNYQKEVCPKLSRAPYVCNGCSKRSLCTLQKCYYYAKEAQTEYKHVLSESRKGIAISEAQLMAMDEYLTPLVQNGQSLYHILSYSRDELMCCEKTVRNYIDQRILTVRNIDLQEQVRYRPQRKKDDGFKVDKSCRINRTIEDYRLFLEDHLHLPIVQMDTLLGTIGGKCLLVIEFVESKFVIAFLRDHNCARSVTAIFDDLYDRLGHELFTRLFPVILTDNGSEFSDPKAIEFKDGQRRAFVFYCDPGKPNQKGPVENVNKSLRSVFPKGSSLNDLTQEQVLLATNHVNSEFRLSLGQRTPYEVFQYFYGEEALKKLGAELIPPDQVTLLPSLTK